jgi:hypothetical protein
MGTGLFYRPDFRKVSDPILNRYRYRYLNTAAVFRHTSDQGCGSGQTLIRVRIQNFSSIRIQKCTGIYSFCHFLLFLIPPGSRSEFQIRIPANDSQISNISDTFFYKV